MLENVGTVDRTLRVVIGTGLLLAGLFGGGTITLVLGGILVATALLSHCPIYKALGKNTCDVPDPRGH